MLRLFLRSLLATFLLSSCAGGKGIFRESEASFCERTLAKALIPEWNKALASSEGSRFTRLKLRAAVNLRLFWLSNRKIVLLALDSWETHSSSREFDLFLERFILKMEIAADKFEDRSCASTYLKHFKAGP